MKSKGLSKQPNYPLALFFAISISLLSSCEKEPYNRYGFDSDFGKNSSGLTMMSTGSHTAFIRLNGHIYMDTGEMQVELIDPNGYIIYNRNFFAPGNYSLNETFKATKGVWKLRYTSLEGSGNIDLHADF